jgi:predicted membrane channel-forming protein YqfA (hemolysin III family)
MTPARRHLVATLVLAATVGAELLVHAAHRSHALTMVVILALALAGFAGVVATHMKLGNEARWLRVSFAVSFALPGVFAVSVVADLWGKGLRP